MMEHHSLYTYLNHFGDTVVHFTPGDEVVLSRDMNHHITFDSDSGAYTVKQSTLDE